MGSTVRLDDFRRGSLARSSPLSYIIALEPPQMRSGATQNQTAYTVGCPNKLLNLLSDSIFESAAEWASVNDNAVTHGSEGETTEGP